MRKHDPINIWEAGSHVLEDFKSRARGERELTCCEQVADILKPYIKSGMHLLDAACGTAHLYHSFRKRDLPITYWGMDSSSKLIKIAREILSEFGLHPNYLFVQNMLELDTSFDIVVSLNTLCFMPDYKSYLERLLNATESIFLLRMSMSDKERRLYVIDGYCDPQYNHMKLYFNTYNINEVQTFIEGYGFTVEHIKDKYTQDGEEIVAGDKKLYRKIFLCKRVTSG